MEIASNRKEVLGRDTAAGHLSDGQDSGRKYADVRLDLAGEVAT